MESAYDSKQIVNGHGHTTTPTSSNGVVDDNTHCNDCEQNGDTNSRESYIHIKGDNNTTTSSSSSTGTDKTTGSSERHFSHSSSSSPSSKLSNGAFHDHHQRGKTNGVSDTEKSLSPCATPAKSVSPTLSHSKPNELSSKLTSPKRLHRTDSPTSSTTARLLATPSIELTIPVYYAGKYIFVTGATGFLGKVFLEKMLRSCPDVAGIYCLVRAKKDMKVEERITELVESKLFDKIRVEQPDFHSKIFPMVGDVILPNLGLSKEDRNTLVERVNIVFHCAATVRFDEPLRRAVEMNVLSVRKMISLCRSFQHLEAFIHVSTAYANCDKAYIEEKVYPPPVDPQKIIDVLGWMDDEMVRLFTPKLIGDKPNTYTYTKQLAEHLLVTEGADLPLAIVRPSIVGAVWKEPFPGWIDNFNGPSGIYIAAGKGILRWMKADQNAAADIVPVDICINIMIAVGWYTAIAKPSSVLIYHTSACDANPVKWGDMEPIVNNCFKQIPLEKCFRRPNVSIVNNSFAQDYWKIVSHLFPAYLCDMALSLVGKKPKMVKVYNKLHRSIDVLQFFTCNEWRWQMVNHEMLRRQLNPDDLATFYVDFRPLHWPTYIKNYCLGAKKFILNEELSGLPAARAHIRKLRIIRTLFNSAICVLLWRVLIAKSQFARNLWFFIVNLVSKFVQFFRITSTMHK